MRASFSSFDQYSIAEVEISEMEVNGSGGVAAPILSVPLRLSAEHGYMAVQDGLEIVSLRGEIFANTGLNLVSELIHIGFIMPQSCRGYKNQHYYLRFPMNSICIATLEQIRAGGDLKFRLDAHLVVNKLRALNQQVPNKPTINTVWGYVQPHKLSLQAELTIPREAWTSRVLNGVGYGQIHIIELPAVPLSACASLGNAFKALQQAQELHKIGLYGEAVGKCRVALEQFFEHEERTGDDNKTRRVPILAKSWEEKLGKITYDWLNNSLSALKSAANKSHHSPNSHYDQFSSQMIIAITITLVAYAARTGKTEE